MWGRPDLNRRPFPETALGCFNGFLYRPLQNFFIPLGGPQTRFVAFWSPSSYLPRLRPLFARHNFEIWNICVILLWLVTEKLMWVGLWCILGFAGHRARVPPDPIPNSEVKPRSVPGSSVVFGHANPGKPAAPLRLLISIFSRIHGTFKIADN
jgi:hypothetical protein